MFDVLEDNIMIVIDLNVDFGEGCDIDEVFFMLVSFVNIVCGWYVGDVNMMC